MQITETDLKALAQSRDKYSKLITKPAVDNTPTETVDEFIARGGKITLVDHGVSGLNLFDVGHKTRSQRFKEAAKKGAKATKGAYMKRLEYTSRNKRPAS